jgi:PadR family transcriptional regulator PadR
MLKGLLELIIFEIFVDREDVYAFELSDLVSEYSGGLINVQHLTLYSPLYRMKDKGYVTMEEKVVANRKRKYYHLQDSGRAYYEKIKKDYETISEGMKRVMGHSKRGKEL